MLGLGLVTLAWQMCATKSASLQSCGGNSLLVHLTCADCRFKFENQFEFGGSCKWLAGASLDKLALKVVTICLKAHEVCTERHLGKNAARKALSEIRHMPFQP